MKTRKAKAAPKKPKKVTPPPKPEHREDPKPAEPTTLTDALQRVRWRANAGDQRAREVLKKFLDAHPDFWSQVGNLALHAESSLVEAATGGEWFASEAVKREAARLRQSLLGRSPTPLETMAVERLALTWLQLQYVESRFTQAQQDLGWAKYWLRRQEQADKLYRSAVRSLALIRELLPGAGDNHQTEPKPALCPIDLGDVPLIEKAAGEPGGVNRIAGLLGSLDRMRERTADDSDLGKPKRNGHRHGLEVLLAAGSG